MRKRKESGQAAMAPAAAIAAVRASVPPRTMGGFAIALAFVAALLAVWAAGATWLLLSGNRLAANAVDRTFQIQDYYEQQGAEYRRVLTATRAEYERAQRDLTRLEQVANERMGVEGRLVEMVRRQSQLEQRQSAMVRLVEQVSGAPVAAVQASVVTAAASVPVPPRRPSVLAERTRSILGVDEEPEEAVVLDPDLELLVPPEEQKDDQHGAADAPVPSAMADAGLGEARAPARKRPSVPPPVQPIDEQNVLEVVNLLQRRIRDLETAQVRDAQTISSSAGQRAALLKQAAETAGRELADIVEPARLKAARVVQKATRPVVDDNSPYGVALAGIRTHAASIRRLAPVVNGLPLRMPVTTVSRVSSTFGPRSDPFLRTARFHAGQDFAAATGTPIYATGGGVVLSAGWGGGYGNLVQVDHGNGLVTRYAHLAEISVTPGQPVAAGQLVGKAGSTGRSTGPHLHYETRLNNVPNDPMRLMRVGAQLGFIKVQTASAPANPVR